MPARPTPLGVMLLALLREGDMHPYEMRRLLIERHDDRLVPVTPGAVYHTVGRLAERGLLAEVGVDREGNRPERTTYTLTPAGNDAINEWVRRALTREGREDEYCVALNECHNLPRQEVRDLLGRRRACLVDESSLYEQGIAKALHRGVKPIYLVEVHPRHRLVQSELDWLDEFLTQLDTASLEWPEGKTTS